MARAGYGWIDITAAVVAVISPHCASVLLEPHLDNSQFIHAIITALLVPLIPWRFYHKMSTITTTLTKQSSKNNSIKYEFASPPSNSADLAVISSSELSAHADLDSKTQWTSIEGIVYDVTSFVSSHPGGSVIRLALGRESTVLVESYHPSTAAKKINNILANQCKLVGRLEGYEPTDNSFFLTVRGRVESYLSQNKFDRHYILPITLSEAAITMLLYLFLSLYVSMYRSYLVAILVGVLTGRLGFLMHTGNHCGVSHNIIINRIVGYFMDVIGSTNVIWSYEHQVAHHMDPNEIEKDNDCEIGNPFFRFHPELKWHPLQSFQHITIPIAMSIGFLKWYLSDFFHYLYGSVGNVTFKATTYDWLVLVTFKAFWFVLHFALPWYYHGLRHALGLSIVLMVIGAHYLENVFIVNHIQHGLVPPPNSHWAIKQVLATANWKSRSHFYNFVSGGLNHQIEHHLFPSVSTWLYPHISPIVQQTCTEFDLPYFNYSCFSEAWLDMNSYLKALGQKDFTVDKYSSKLVKSQ
jgi:fatty acid desaturase/cytochrome b involved in lipid metabolism